MAAIIRKGLHIPREDCRRPGRTTCVRTWIVSLMVCLVLGLGLGGLGAAGAQDAIGEAPPATGHALSGTATAPLDAAALNEARQRYRTAEGARRRAEGIRIRRPRATTMAKMNEWLQARFVPTMERRVEAIGQARAAYERVIALGPSAPAIASIRRTGDLYFDIAAEVDAVPMPLEIQRDPELAAAYRGALEQHTAPLRERAFEAYAACLQMAARLGHEDASVRHARRRLTLFAPERLPAP